MKAEWKRKPLQVVCDVFADGDWIESKDQSLEGIRLIQTGNIGEGFFKDRSEKARYISEETFKKLRCTEIFEGDCLISRLPDPVGRSCLLPYTGERMITAVDCTIIRFDQKQVVPAFFNYYSQSYDYLQALDSETTGTTRKRISRSKLGLTPIPIPTILTTSQKLSTGVDARNVRNIVLLRPINTMIEFKQIIGRGTRLYDGKDYFTIYDFVKAHHHFSDPEWDGEPLAPEPKTESTSRLSTPSEPPETELDPSPRRQKIRVQLADNRARNIQHMVCTTYWHPDGTPMTAPQFMELLFGKLPEFFKDEAELRVIWSDPDTRRKFLQGLAEQGFGREQLSEMQRIIDAEKSDLFDVLAYVAYAVPLLTREERAVKAKGSIISLFTTPQQRFLDFVLSHYVNVGVDELDQTKLMPLLILKYDNSIADAVADLGKPDEIRKVFSGFQKYLYQVAA